MSPAIIAQLTTLRDAGKLRWYAGMVAIYNDNRVRIAWIRDDRSAGGAIDGDEWAIMYGDLRDGLITDLADALPDLDDPVTAVAFLLMAREAWGDPALHAHPHRNGYGDLRWTARSWVDGLSVTISDRVYDTELEALIAAIHAAPEK